MSIGGPTSTDDIYDFTWRFLGLDTTEALLNADSYALFAGGIVNGIRTTILFPVFSVSGGGVTTQRGPESWYGRMYLGAEFQHPVLRVFNPTIGFSATLIGETQSLTGTPGANGPSVLASVLAGVRITDPRPGTGGAGYVNLFGGPSLAINPSAPEGRQRALGAEAGIGIGYRWRWLDVGLTGGVFVDPTRDEGRQRLLFGGLSISGVLDFSSIPGSH
jgi:hypothetical protein